MQGFQGQSFQYQQVESSTQKIGSFFTHSFLLSEYDISRLKGPLNLENTALDPTSSSSCPCAARVCVGYPGKFRNQPVADGSRDFGWMVDAHQC
jgi:hypothetical protein